MNKNYGIKDYRVNKEASSDLPRVLFFQGSYLNSRKQFFESNFKEYIIVHNYENLLDFDYYFNIFKPDCVVLETAEYATNTSFFDYNKMKSKKLNELLEITEDIQKKGKKLKDLSYKKETKGNLVNLKLDNTFNATKGYCVIRDKQYDLAVDSKQIACTLDVSNFSKEEEEAAVLYLF